MNEVVRGNTKKSIKKSFIDKMVNTREMGIIISLLLICLITTIINPTFIDPNNIIDVLRSISFTLIVSVGMTFVLISGGLDLSVGSIVGLSGMITGFGLVNNMPIFLAILIGLIVGGIFGFLNGYIIVRFKIPPLIVTLGTMYIARGVVYVISKGKPFYPFPEGFKQIGQGFFLNVPYSVYLAFFIVILGGYVLKNTIYGRSVMAIGGNEEASRVSGIDTKKVKVLTYTLVGVLAGMAGILMAARLSSSQAGAGTGWEMTVIASVIIGGTSMYGGSGSIIGTVIGTTIMAVLTNSMVLMDVSVYWQKIVVGFIIIFAVGIDTYRRSKMSGSRG